MKKTHIGYAGEDDAFISMHEDIPNEFWSFMHNNDQECANPRSHNIRLQYLQPKNFGVRSRKGVHKVFFTERPRIVNFRKRDENGEFTDELRREFRYERSMSSPSHEFFRAIRVIA